MSTDFVAVDHAPSSATLCPAVSSPARPINPFQDGLPDLTLRQISYRVERLARVFSLSAEDTEDLRESLVLEVYRAMPRHNPSIAKATTFAKGVMDIWYLQTCKELRKRLALQCRYQSLPEPGAEGRAFVAPRLEPGREVGLRLDLREALHSLPRNLWVLANELRTKSVSDIAAERRVHRATVLRMVMKLRGFLSNLDPALD
jgi:hypothetical protein